MSLRGTVIIEREIRHWYLRKLIREDRSEIKVDTLMMTTLTTIATNGS